MEMGKENESLDDDGRVKRTGTLMTASVHIITAVIGSGVLSLAWVMAQLGWVAGPVSLVAFSVITWFTSILLADCYRSDDPVPGKRNYTYVDAVRTNLGGYKVRICGLAQIGNLIGATIGYTITAGISMAAVIRSNCFHKNGHHAKCQASNYPFIIIFGGIQIVLSQIPNFHKLSWLSMIAAVMSFSYTLIGIGLSIAQVAGGNNGARTGLTGVVVGLDVTVSEKVWKTFQAIGNVAFAYTFSPILIEIQDTLKSSPPENKVMKKATSIGVSTIAFLYIVCGGVGYAAFGNDAPGNFLTGFGFYEPFWLIDFANLCIAVHLVGAYQVFAQPLFRIVENWCITHWPENGFITPEHAVKIPLYGKYHINFFQVVWRTVYVVSTTVIAMIFPFFNDILGLVGAISYWPLTVYLPIEMYIVRSRIPRFSFTWTWLKVLSFTCLLVAVVAAVGSVQGLAAGVKTYKLFKT
ncbi:PREDICTED: amino acid permease 6-like [Nelumbo nucifera]|uniref:Amino acid permease 6-like n=1 Tax=Nelumbo nucifera TaxID=4432 RepID=A0A1U7Z7D8_NELNU|nr:PREDICTED: amino acid permease 6-like [Nelumbo nucifera]